MKFITLEALKLFKNNVEKELLSLKSNIKDGVENNYSNLSKELNEKISDLDIKLSNKIDDIKENNELNAFDINGYNYTSKKIGNKMMLTLSLWEGNYLPRQDIDTAVLNTNQYTILTKSGNIPKILILIDGDGVKHEMNLYTNKTVEGIDASQCFSVKIAGGTYYCYSTNNSQVPFKRFSYKAPNGQKYYVCSHKNVYQTMITSNQENANFDVDYLDFYFGGRIIASGGAGGTGGDGHNNKSGGAGGTGGIIEVKYNGNTIDNLYVYGGGGGGCGGCNYSAGYWWNLYNGKYGDKYTFWVDNPTHSYGGAGGTGGGGSYIEKAIGRAFNKVTFIKNSAYCGKNGGSGSENRAGNGGAAGDGTPGRTANGLVGGSGGSCAANSRSFNLIVQTWV